MQLDGERERGQRMGIQIIRCATVLYWLKMYIECRVQAGTPVTESQKLTKTRGCPRT